jgi:hypothetical protein
MQRIAVPMISGKVSSTLLTLMVIPATASTGRACTVPISRVSAKRRARLAMRPCCRVAEK